MLYRLILLKLVLFTGNAYTQTSKPVFKLQKVDAYVQQLVKEWNVAGCAVGIVYKDSLVFAKGYGYRDVAQKLPVTPQTLFIIGSNSKLFTSIAAAMLHVEKKLDLDRPARTYMPELRFSTPELDDKLTLRDMLSHRSGVPRWDGVWFGADDSDSLWLSKLPYLFPTRSFRETLLYNNHYYSVAGLISGKVSGSHYEDFIRKKLFTPLEMNQSCLGINNISPNSDWGYDYLFVPLKNTLIPLINADYFCNCIIPAGLIVSNISDLSHWAIALLNNGMYKNKQVIPAAAITETMRPVNSGFNRYRYPEVVDAGYGLGRNLAFYKGHYFSYHGGSAGGYRTEISFFPNDSLSIMVLSNTVQGQYMTLGAVLGIADRLMGLDETLWSDREMRELNNQVAGNKRQLDSLRSLQVKNTRPSHELAEYTGIYESKIYGTIRITLDSGQLTLHYRNNKRPLEHFHYDQFWTKEPEYYALYPQLYPVYRLHFQTNERGQIFMFRTSIMNDPVTEFIKRF